jgi:uncharacterized membrane protein
MATVAHKGFILGVIWKGIEGVSELAMAIALNFVRVETLRGTLVGHALNHLSYDPDDLFWSHLLAFAQQLSLSGKLFATAYLFAHGLLRIFMCITLMKNRRWAYPVSMVLLALFFVYQCVHLMHKFSIGLAILSTVDPALLILVWIEFRKQYGSNARLF